MNTKDAARASSASPAVSPSSYQHVLNKSMRLIHPIRDLGFTLVAEVSFSVRIEVINAISLQEEAGMLPRADILPLAVFTKHFQMD